MHKASLVRRGRWTAYSSHRAFILKSERLPFPLSWVGHGLDELSKSCRMNSALRSVFLPLRWIYRRDNFIRYPSSTEATRQGLFSAFSSVRRACVAWYTFRCKIALTGSSKAGPNRNRHPFINEIPLFGDPWRTNRMKISILRLKAFLVCPQIRHRSCRSHVGIPTCMHALVHILYWNHPP